MLTHGTRKKRLSIIHLCLCLSLFPYSFFLFFRPSHQAFEQTDLQDNLHSSDIVLLGPHLDHGAQPRPHGLQVRRLPHLEQRLRDQRLAPRQLLSVLKIYSIEIKIFAYNKKYLYLFWQTRPHAEVLAAGGHVLGPQQRVNVSDEWAISEEDK